MTFLEDVVGHEDVRAHLRRMLEADRVPNGVLLHGASGRGKRTLATAFARVLVGAAADDHPDLFMVTREENQRLIGIDRVRALKEEFSLTPVQATRRAAVVVDAERLTGEAGNALLKLLEEPPPHSHLILTARDRGAVMETLVSRCRPLRVPPLSSRQVVDFLKSRGVAEERAALLAMVADGRPGHAMSLAEAEFEERVLGPALRLLAPGAEVSLAAEEINGLVREGTKKPEAARDRARTVLDCAAWFLRGALKEANGARGGDAVLSLLESPLRDAIAGRDSKVVERQLEALLRAQQDIDRNVSLDVLLSDLVPSMSSRV